MTRPISRMRAVGVAVLCASLLAGCALPRSGPSRDEILSGSAVREGDAHVVQVNDFVAEQARSLSPLGFSSSFLDAGAARADRIAPGDVLSVTVWENVDNGLLASVGQKVTLLQEIQVDQGGSIFMPYAGRLRAAGKTPEELRRLIAEKLADQTPDPQVEVRRLAGDGATVSIMGGVAAQGVYPIEAPTRRLAGMIAKAGGVALDPDVAQVKIMREGRTGSIWLQDLYDQPMANIALRPGDQIVVEEDRRIFTALGATGGQTRVPFTSRDLNVLEAIAEVGGLNSALADPTGVFVFREEPPYVANRVLGRTDLREAQRFAYVIDLTTPTGMFTARDFTIRDGDTIYVTEAPFVGWQKIMSGLMGTVNFAGSLKGASDLVNGN